MPSSTLPRYRRRKYATSMMPFKHLSTSTTSTAMITVLLYLLTLLTIFASPTSAIYMLTSYSNSTNCTYQPKLFTLIDTPNCTEPSSTNTNCTLQTIRGGPSYFTRTSCFSRSWNAMDSIQSNAGKIPYLTQATFTDPYTCWNQTSLVAFAVDGLCTINQTTGALTGSYRLTIGAAKDVQWLRWNSSLTCQGVPQANLTLSAAGMGICNDGLGVKRMVINEGVSVRMRSLVVPLLTFAVLAFTL
ncbi:hypothetical protein HDV05_004005 [Chytridiales sp. JEL 0842]|nr:hypothetical protein HDV05_004005 [Chytridiales sp. JEL 0842]